MQGKWLNRKLLKTYYILNLPIAKGSTLVAKNCVHLLAIFCALLFTVYIHKLRQLISYLQMKSYPLYCEFLR